MNFPANGSICLTYGYVKATIEKHYLFACSYTFSFCVTFIGLKGVGILDDGKGPFNSVSCI